MICLFLCPGLLFHRILRSTKRGEVFKHDGV